MTIYTGRKSYIGVLSHKLSLVQLILSSQVLMETTTVVNALEHQMNQDRNLNQGFEILNVNIVIFLQKPNSILRDTQVKSICIYLK